MKWSKRRFVFSTSRSSTVTSCKTSIRLLLVSSPLDPKGSGRLLRQDDRRFLAPCPTPATEAAPGGLGHSKPLVHFILRFVPCAALRTPRGAWGGSLRLLPAFACGPA